MDAKATMGVYRLHKDDWERASGTTTQIQAPEPMDLWDLDRESNSTFKRKDLAKRLGIDEYSSVCPFPLSLYFIYNDCFIKQNRGRTLRPRMHTVCIEMMRGGQAGRRSRRSENPRRRVCGILPRLWIES